MRVDLVDRWFHALGAGEVQNVGEQLVEPLCGAYDAAAQRYSLTLTQTIAQQAVSTAPVLLLRVHRTEM